MPRRNANASIARPPREPACWHWPVPAEGDLEKLRAGIVAERLEFDLPDRTDTREELRWILMAEWMDDRCAVCGQQRRGRGLVEDHDHDTGLFRGFLCQSCNLCEAYQSEGIFQMYRERSPAIIFNIKEQYTNLYAWGHRSAPLNPPGSCYG